MPKYPWGLVSSCLNEQWLCVVCVTLQLLVYIEKQAFWHRSLFSEVFCCNTSSPDHFIRGSLTMCKGTAGRTDATWGCGRYLVFTIWKGDLGQIKCAAWLNISMLITAEEAPDESLLIERSSVTRGSVGLWCLLEQTDPQFLLSCPFLPCFFFSLGFYIFSCQYFSSESLSS